MRKVIFFTSLLISLTTGAQTTLTKKWAVPGGSVNVVIQYPGKTSATGSPLPAVVAYPGKGEFGSNSALLYNNTPLNFAKAGTFTPNMIVVAVQVPDACCPGTWQLAATVMDSLYKGNYGIDWNKVYMTGLSYGAATIMNYIQQTPDAQFKKPAAVAIMSINMTPLCGNYYSKTDSLCGNDKRFATIPNWCFCGTQDAFYEFQTNYVNREKAAGYPVKYTTAVEGHGPWLQWLDPKFGLYDWFLSYSNTVVAPPPVNKPPIASAGSPQTITLPTSQVTLDCSGSYDPDGRVVSCNWTLTSAPSTAGLVSISNGVAAGLNAAGTYVFTLQVTDDKGATATAKTTVTVNPAPKVVLFSIKLIDGKTFTLYADGSYTLI